MSDEKKSAKIFSLTTNHPPTGYTPKSVIELIQDLNLRAERGELTGIAVAYVQSSGRVAVQMEQGSSSSSQLVSAVTALFWDINKKWSKE